MAVENLVRLRCKDYGFECDFEVEVEDEMKIMQIFGNHISLEHGVKYEIAFTNFL